MTRKAFYRAVQHRETAIELGNGGSKAILAGDGLVTTNANTDASGMPCTTQTFGQINFADADLGDQRRTRRLVATADLMTRRPAGSLPQKLHNPKDLKAFYRLMSCDEVTHEAIMAPHRRATFREIDACENPVLVLHDATELDFTSHESLSKELGQIGNGNRRGYIAQNSLAVDSKTRRVIGLCDQILHHRADVPPDETPALKRGRETRESLLWLRGVKSLPANKKLVDVCDQGADTFEFMEHELHSGRRFVIRAAYDRRICVGHDASSQCQSSHLRTFLRTLPPDGTWSLSVTSRVKTKRPKRKGKKKKVVRTARDATMAVSFAAIQIKSPSKKNGVHSRKPLKIWAVRVWELDPPEGEERLEWFLVTNEVVETFESAYRVVGWYECRWIVEEYHKGMKTGCSVESPQFTTEARLQPALALISIVTLTLLEMRDASRRKDAKSRPAREIISEDYVAVLSAWRHNQVHEDWSIHDFYYALARLGGHQNRKGDHAPGWQTIWKGWGDLQAMVAGVAAMKTAKQCG